MFTKRIGEVGVYAGAQAIVYIVALLPVLLTGGFMLFGMAGALGNMGALNDLGVVTSGIEPVFSALILTYVMAFVSFIALVIGAAPLLTGAALTVVTTTVDNLSDNINLMIKNALSKWGRILGTIGLIIVVFIVVGIAIAIVMAILGLIFRFIPFIGLIILALVGIALYIGVAYFAVPLYFAVFDAFLTDKPLITNITNALTKTDKYRLPLLLTVIVVGIAIGIVGGILGAIFGFIPFIGWILSLIVYLVVMGAGVIVLLCAIYPYYKEYAGITA